MMKCAKVCLQLAAFSSGEIGDSEGKKIQEHLAGCANCRESLRTTQQLRALLALKCYERPDEFFFRTYLVEFHRRLLSGIVREIPLWAKVCKIFSFGDGWKRIYLRFGWGVFVGVVFLCFYIAHVMIEKRSSAHLALGYSKGISSQTFQDEASALSDLSPMEVASTFNHLILADNHSNKNLIYVMDHVHYEPSSHGSVVLEF